MPGADCGSGRNLTVSASFARGLPGGGAERSPLFREEVGGPELPAESSSLESVSEDEEEDSGGSNLLPHSL